MYRARGTNMSAPREWVCGPLWRPARPAGPSSAYLGDWRAVSRGAVGACGCCDRLLDPAANPGRANCHLSRSRDTHGTYSYSWTYGAVLTDPAGRLSANGDENMLHSTVCGQVVGAKPLV